MQFSMMTKLDKYIDTKIHTTSLQDWLIDVLIKLSPNKSNEKRKLQFPYAKFLSIDIIRRTQRSANPIQ